MIKPMRFFLLYFISLFAMTEYGWVQDIENIDPKKFNYEEGSDPDLDLYVKPTFVSDIKLSPDGKHIALQSDSEEFTQGIIISDLEKFYTLGLEGSAVAKLAVDNSKGDPDLGVRALFFSSVRESLIDFY